LRNWILILALLSLHGCKVFNPESNFCKYSLLLINDAGSDDGIREGGDSCDAGNAFTSLLHLNAIAGEEEQEHFLLNAHSYSLSFFNLFSFTGNESHYSIRNLLGEFSVPIYLFCKSLIL
jgi:hypothetical protein